MLKHFEVSNYRNFKDKLEIDFGTVGGYQFNSECIMDDTVCKMLIYGSNATGKTNLGKALMDIIGNMSGVRFLSMQNSLYLNADSKEITASFKYAYAGKNYYQYMRYIFNEIILHNIFKASLIQWDKYNVPPEQVKSFFENIDLADILWKQNFRSRDDENGLIWVINTSVFLAPDYNFNLLR